MNGRRDGVRRECPACGHSVATKYWGADQPRTFVRHSVWLHRVKVECPLSDSPVELSESGVDRSQPLA